jgi:hypothetical protein
MHGRRGDTGIAERRGQGRGTGGERTLALEDAQYLGARHGAHLGDAVRVTQDDTDLRGGQALARQLAAVLLHLQAQPVTTCISACHATPEQAPPLPPPEAPCGETHLAPARNHTVPSPSQAQHTSKPIHLRVEVYS